MSDEKTPSDYAFELTTGHIERATKQSAAFDLFYSGSVPLWIGDSPVKVPTGVRSRFSKNLVAVIKEKSGLALKGIEVKGGIIDADYRDEWAVILRYPIQYPAEQGELAIPAMMPLKEWQPFKIEPGMAVAQFLLWLLPDVHFFAMPSASVTFKDEERAGGFGSTTKVVVS